jgi:hypothetical protein
MPVVNRMMPNAAAVRTLLLVLLLGHRAAMLVVVMDVVPAMDGHSTTTSLLAEVMRCRRAIDVATVLATVHPTVLETCVLTVLFLLLWRAEGVVLMLLRRSSLPASGAVMLARLPGFVSHWDSLLLDPKPLSRDWPKGRAGHEIMVR